MPLPGVSHWMLACLWVAAVLLGLPEAHTVSEIVRNYYDVLKVEPAATDRQIKKAFHQLALKYHPDRNKSSDAEKSFREIAEAYEVLSDKEKRRQYDEWGHEAFLQQDYYNPEDVYEEPFFSFDYVFDMFDDDDPFLEEPYYRWTVPQDMEDQDNHFEHWGTDFVDPEDFPGWG